METRRRHSTESSSFSYSSGSSYYACGSSVVSDEEDGAGRTTKSRTFFDDVKVILSRHDSKLSRLEDDLSCVVRWLNEKFDFIMKYDSTSSIPGWEEHTNVTNSDDPMMRGASTSTSFPLASPVPAESESFDEENDSDDAESAKHSTLTLHDYCPTNNEDEDVFMPPGVKNVSGDKDTRELIDDPSNRITPVKNANMQVIMISSKTATTTTTSASISATASAPSVVQKTRSAKQSKSTANTQGSQRPSQCDTCGKFLKDKSSLRQHKKIHLNIRPFVCNEPECGKSFRRKFHLQTHALIHKGVRDHQCGYCGRCFLLQKDLVTHERIHTGEKPFSCEICSKRFSLKSHLKMHSRIHSKERPYKCEICDKTFSQSNTLRLHKKRLHRETNDASGLQSTKKSWKKNNRKRKEKEVVASANNAVPPTTTILTMPAKLPLYRNQSTVLGTTSCRNVPIMMPRLPSTITILQQPITGSHQSIELVEQVGTLHVNPSDKIILSETTMNMLSTLCPPSSGGGGVSTESTSVPVISTGIVSIPQQIILPRNSNNNL